MAQIYFPYVTLEEKEGLKVLHSDKLFIGEAHIKDKHFLVFDDGVMPPWEFEEVTKMIVLETLKIINALETVAGIPLTKAADFRDAVIARLNV